MTGCQNDDDNPFSKPGSRGKPPTDINIIFHEFHITHDPIPDILLCNVQYKIVGAAGTIVEACEIVDYFDLYTEARDNALSRAKSLKCPQKDAQNNCPRKIVTEIARKGTCKNLDARVEVSFTVECKADNAPRSPGLAMPDENALNKRPTKPFDEKIDPPPQSPFEENELIATTNDSWRFPLTCPTRVPMIASITTYTPCNVIQSYGPYILKAKLLAKKMAAKVPCPKGCERGDIEEIYLKWHCVGHTVEVDYFFYVPCKKKD